MATLMILEEAFHLESSMFKIAVLNAYQKLAIRKIVVEREDVFVNFHTGSEKSLIYQALPLVFDHVSDVNGHVVVVVSPLVSLMDNQVKYLQSLGLSAFNISSDSEADRSKIEKGEYSLAYGSPEAWLMNERWRCMLSSDVYSRKLCAIAVNEAHVIWQWGMSEDNKTKAFRECYGHPRELRSFASNAKTIALTATASKLTKESILNILLMEKPFEVQESPNKPNVSYTAKSMQKDAGHELYFEYLFIHFIFLLNKSHSSENFSENMIKPFVNY